MASKQEPSITLNGKRITQADLEQALRGLPLRVRRRVANMLQAVELLLPALDALTKYTDSKASFSMVMEKGKDTKISMKAGKKPSRRVSHG